VVLADSGDRAAPTVDVVDDGIGITPERFPGTILSLQARNKIDKWYVIGAFGQGGASTLAFCDYCVIVSRHKDNPRVVGFTVTRVVRTSANYKEDSYAYLCVKDAAGVVSAPSCQLDAGPITLYLGRGDKPPKLAKGTLVRHVGYKLPKLEASLGASPGNLYHYLHCSAFDPLLPFRLIDLAPHGTQEPCVGIEYWVVLNYRKKGDNPHVLRASSSELYVQRGLPILGTLNGQNQGELTGQLIREAGLGMVSRHIIVHIDATRADSRVRRELFSTNREGFKDGTVLTSLTQHLEKMIEEDQTLYDIERELTEAVARRESQTTSEEVKRQVQRLLLDAGLQVREEGGPR
jgi:hypothetical protein